MTHRGSRKWVGVLAVGGLLVAAGVSVCVTAAGAADVAGGAPAPDKPLPDKVDFNRDVRPILSENCYFCHGPDKGTREADVRLDTKEGLLAVSDNGAIVKPGHPADSELIRRIVTDDPAERMPDPKSNKRLSPREVAVLKKWIEQGAEYQGHWAYLPPKRPSVPAVDEPGFVRNDVDRFVLAKLKENALAHAGEADRVTLLRRLSLDLTGLPPTPAEVDAFVNDRSADAYDKVVDRLLASPAFGERLAMYWLDVVRYADTIGYHSDNPMNVSPYRAYVVQSFNANKPFDRFTIEQLAGDLLPDPTLEQRVATAYNRLLQTTEEGGAQGKEYEQKYLADRVRSVTTAWLGVTMGCAQCHDHKFDPLTMREFYELGAFFADVQEANTGRREPGIPVPDGSQADELKKLDDALAAAKARLDKPDPALAAAQAEWEENQAAAPVEWKPLAVEKLAAAGGSKLAQSGDGTIRATGPAPAKDTFTVTAATDLHRITGFRLEALDDDGFPARGPGQSPNGNFVLTEFKVSAASSAVQSNGRKEKPKAVKLARASATHAQDDFPVAHAIDGKDNTGWAVLPQAGKAHEAIFEPAEPVGAPGGTALVLSIEFQSQFAQHQVGKFRLSVTTSPAPAGVKSLPDKVRAALAVAPGKRSDAQKNDLAAYYRTIAPALQPARDEVAAIEAKREALLKAVPKCLVTTAGGKPRTVRVLPRGNWMDDTGPVVSPGVPAALGALPKTDGRQPNRLDLAKWIVARENPLTARVFVNRLWKLYFGQGLSKVLDDLGAQGEWPTHPELLDWLAVEFMDGGWDVKRTVRLLVTSGAYRQSSKPTPEMKERDPFNRLYARQSRFRLDAEVVRDNALAVSGLLVPELGGPSVFPYQPAGYWFALNFPTREWKNDKGPGLYRRGLYTHWQRSFPHPSLLAFDAPSREEAVCERTRSNIPQQALVLLNDPTYVEAARVLAERIVKEGGATEAERIAWAFRQAVSRPPTEKEAKVLAELYAKHKREYAADVPLAQKLLAVGDHPAAKDVDPAELAAWTSVARTILNLSETITRY